MVFENDHSQAIAELVYSLRHRDFQNFLVNGRLALNYHAFQRLRLLSASATLAARASASAVVIPDIRFIAFL